MLRYDLQTPPTALVPIGYAGISDERARFREIFCAIQQDHGSRFPDNRQCDQALHRLNDEPAATDKPVHLGNALLPVRLVIVPGVMEECVSGFITPFSDARPHVEAYGFKTDLLMVGGLAGCAHNARQIQDAVARMQRPADEKLVFIGYSKGAADVLEALGRYPDLAERTALTAFLRERGIVAVFHYIPLHSAAAGLKYCRFHGEDRYTTRESERLLRLPLYYGLTEGDCAAVIDAVKAFYHQ